MKVLYITDNYLDSNSGGNFANRAFVNAFSEIADTCLLLYPDRGQEIRNYLNKKIIIKGIPNKKNNINKLLDIYRGKINQYIDTAIPEIRSFDPEIVVFDGSTCSSGLIKKIKSLGFKAITIHQNYEIEYYNGTPPSLLWRIPFMHYLKKAEREAVQLSDLNLTLTSQDAELLRLHYDSNRIAKLRTLGCFESKPTSEIKTISSEFNNSRQQAENVLVFAITGSLCSHQTETSLIPFIKYTYPSLLEKLSANKLFVAGRNPSSKLIEACAKYPTIDLIANPADMQLILDQADIYICPIDVGGGLKLRVMDALKAGLPVIAHAVSARGYDAFIKAGFLFVYDDKQSFLESLELLLAQRFKGRLEKEEIKRLYLSMFSFESGIRRLKDFLFDSRLMD
jgi:glycosyltransferase involved in cell wall biosynthesis